MSSTIAMLAVVVLTSAPSAGAGDAHVDLGRRRRRQSVQPDGALQDVRRRHQQDRHQRRDQLPRSRPLRRGDDHQVDHASTVTRSTRASSRAASTGIIINVAPGNRQRPAADRAHAQPQPQRHPAAGTRSGLNGIRILAGAAGATSTTCWPATSLQRGIKRPAQCRRPAQRHQHDRCATTPAPASACRRRQARRGSTSPWTTSRSVGNGDGDGVQQRPARDDQQQHELEQLELGHRIDVDRWRDGGQRQSEHGQRATAAPPCSTTGTSLLRFSDTDIAFNQTGFSGATLTFGSEPDHRQPGDRDGTDAHRRHVRSRADLAGRAATTAPRAASAWGASMREPRARPNT